MHSTGSELGSIFQTKCADFLGDISSFRGNGIKLFERLRHQKSNAFTID